MLQGLLYKWFHPRSVGGVAVQLGPAPNEYRFDWVVLEQQKGKAVIKDTGNAVGDMVLLKKSLPERVPVALTLTGKGILVRKVPMAKAEQLDVLAQEMLPGAKASDYYFDAVPASLGQVLVAMVRRSTVDSLFGQAKDQGIEVLQLHLGPLAMAEIGSLIEFNTAEKQVDVSGYSIKLNHDNVPEQIERTESAFEGSYTIAGELLPSSQVLPFATALGFWLLPAEELVLGDATGHQYEEYLHKRFFQVGLKSVLGVFFIALLLNFVLFNQQYNLNAELKQLSGNKQEQLQRFELLKKKHDQNLAFLGSEGWLQPAKASYYADGIAATVPKDIVLTQMTVYPDTVARKTGQTRSRYQNNAIVLMGQASSSLYLQEWTTKLRNVDWVKGVTVKNYSQENPAAPGVFDMAVEVKP